jgi:hypothetical protein
METEPAERRESEDIHQCEFCACWTRDGVFHQGVAYDFI